MQKTLFGKEIEMKITVIGCGRWGSLIAWYLDRRGHEITLYGRSNSANMQSFLSTRSNGLLTLPESVILSTSLSSAEDADIIIISINSQGLRSLMQELKPLNLEKNMKNIKKQLMR